MHSSLVTPVRGVMCQSHRRFSLPRRDKLTSPPSSRSPHTANVATTTTSTRAIPARGYTRWRVFSKSSGDISVDAAVTIGDGGYDAGGTLSETKEIPRREIEDEEEEDDDKGSDAPGAAQPLIDAIPASFRDEQSRSSAGIVIGDGEGDKSSKSNKKKNKAPRTIKVACKGCQGTGLTRCRSCGGSGTLAPGGFHAKNHVDVKNIVGTNWTAHRRTRGWRHFEAVGKSPADKANGKLAMVHLAATCDRDITVWVRTPRLLKK